MIRRSRRLLVAALVCLGIAVPALLFAAQYPQWWVWIAQEQVPMTWFQSVTLVVAGAVALIAWFICRASGRLPRAGFALLALGFAALAFDERFAIHERIRDGVLAPRGIRLPLLTWIAPGDFLLLLLALVGLALLPIILRVFRRDRWSLTLFALAVLLSLVTVGMDSVDPETWSVQAERVQQTLEECIELWAGLSFLGAVTLRLLGLLVEILETPLGLAAREDSAAATGTDDTALREPERPGAAR